MHGRIIHPVRGDKVTVSTLLDFDACLTEKSLEEMELYLTDAEESQRSYY